MSGNSQPKKRLHQQIALALAERINSGAYPDRTKLPSERELARHFGASRTSIRQAMASLQSSGLVTLNDRARPTVTRLNNSALFAQLGGTAQALLAQPDGIADFQEARTLFECGLVRHAARHASPKEIDKLKMALLLNKRAIGDPQRFAHSDLAFHNMIAEIPGNSIFVALNNALGEWLAEQRHIGLRSTFRTAMKEAYEGHEQVFEAIAAQDADAAERAMTDHLRIVSMHYWNAAAGREPPH